MAQHFLISARARTLSLRDVYTMGEDAASGLFLKLRWPATDGAPVCPGCGSLEHYVTARRRFACRDCRKQYTATSGTILASRKMSFTDLLAAICLVANAAKGISALQLAATSAAIPSQLSSWLTNSGKLWRSKLPTPSCPVRSRLMVPISAATFALRTARKTVRTVV
jgi:hypothetical protein